MALIYFFITVAKLISRYGRHYQNRETVLRNKETD